MISKRTLEKYRREALNRIGTWTSEIKSSDLANMNMQIIKLTQELLDQHLLRKEDPKLDH